MALLHWKSMTFMLTGPFVSGPLSRVVYYFVLEQSRFILTIAEQRNLKQHLKIYMALKQRVK